MTDMAPAEITPGGDGVRSGQAGIAELLWGMRERPARGPKPAFSIGHIARVAVDIADTDGVQAVSMQRVASELQFTKMAMYRYVSGKAELLAVMIEEAVGEPPDLRRVAGGWRPRLEEWARCMWAAWDRHPWLPAATAGERIMGPNETDWIECAVAALAGTGLDGGEQMDAVAVLSGHIRSSQSAAAAGTQPWTTGRQREVLLAHADRYPAVTAALAGAAAPQARDSLREFGLTRILDGLAMLIGERPSHRRAKTAAGTSAGAAGHGRPAAGTPRSAGPPPATAAANSDA